MFLIELQVHMHVQTVYKIIVKYLATYFGMDFIFCAHALVAHSKG